MLQLSSKLVICKRLQRNLKVISLFQQNFLSGLHWNINGIGQKSDKLDTILKISVEKKIDFFSLNETKSNDIKLDNVANKHFQDYNFYHRSRPANHLGGGVVLAVVKSIKSERIHDFDDFQSELICVKLTLTKLVKTVYLFTIYNPPLEKLNVDLFKKIDDNCKEYVICGDLNARYILEGKTIKRNRNSLILDQKIMTQIRGKILNNKNFTFSRSKSILDLVISTLDIKSESFHVFNDYDKSDHFPIYFHFNIHNNWTHYALNKLLSANDQVPDSSFHRNLEKVDTINIDKDKNIHIDAEKILKILKHYKSIGIYEKEAPLCNKCHLKMTLRLRKHLKDKYTWTCLKCKTFKTLKVNSIPHKLNLQTIEFDNMLNYWVDTKSLHGIDLKISEQKLMNSKKYFHNISKHFLNELILGNTGNRLIEIDYLPLNIEKGIFVFSFFISILTLLLSISIK
jgi:exonuclease III